MATKTTSSYALVLNWLHSLLENYNIRLPRCQLLLKFLVCFSDKYWLLPVHSNAQRNTAQHADWSERLSYELIGTHHAAYPKHICWISKNQQQSLQQWGWKIAIIIFYQAWSLSLRQSTYEPANRIHWPDLYRCKGSCNVPRRKTYARRTVLLLVARRTFRNMQRSTSLTASAINLWIKIIYIPTNHQHVTQLKKLIVFQFKHNKKPASQSISYHIGTH